MRNLIVLLVLLSLSCLGAEQDKIILTNTSIGSMPIEVGSEISLYKINQFFPYYKVTQQIASGDSPDYHIFVVSTYAGEELLSFISYINEADGYEKGIVKLDEVIIYSARVQDQYGVTPNMPISQAIAKRKVLIFGAGHTDNYLGNGNIWYMFSLNESTNTLVTLETAVAADPKINAISWPNPWWF
jgi:hypothetical protein